jgi:O-antigen/teichoic acid export membrane protein
VIQILGLQVAMSLPAVVFGGILSGMQRYDLHNVVGISVLGLRTVLLVILLQRHPSLLVLCAVTVAADALGYIATVLIALRVCPRLRLQWPWPTRAALARLFRYSSITFLISAGGQLISRTHSIIVAALLPVSAITTFAVATNLMAYARNLIEETGNVLNPAASELQVMRRLDQLRQLSTLTTRGLLAIALPITLTFIFLGKAFIVLWMGQRYAVSANILLVLAAGQVFALAQCGSCSILYGLARHNLLARLVLAEGGVTLVLSMILIKAYGLIGMAFAVTVPALIFEGIGIPMVLCRELAMPLRSYIRRAYLPPFLAAVPFALVEALAAGYAVGSWLRFAIVVATAMLVYLPGCLLWFLDPAHRQTLGRLLVRRPRVLQVPAPPAAQSPGPTVDSRCAQT